MYIYTYTHMHIHIRMQIRIHIHIHLHIHIYIYMCAYTHDWVTSRSIGHAFALVFVLLRVTWNIGHDSFMHAMAHLFSLVFASATHPYVSNASFIRVTCRLYTCDVPHSYVWHASFIRVTCLIHTCDMPHSYVRHVSFIRVTCLIRTSDMTHSNLWQDLLISVIWPVHVSHDAFMCVTLTRWYVSHDSFICALWLIHVCDMNHWYLSHDMCDVKHWFMRRESFICATSLVRMRHMTSSCMWHASFMYVTWLILTCCMIHWYMWHGSPPLWHIHNAPPVHTSDMTHFYVRHDSFLCATWLISIYDMTHSNGNIVHVT